MVHNLWSLQVQLLAWFQAFIGLEFNVVILGPIELSTESQIFHLNSSLIIFLQQILLYVGLFVI